MKAKEMAATFKADPTAKTASGLVYKVIMETKELAEKRKISSDSALAVILKEADDKWRAFARLCPEIHPDGFKLAIHKSVPASKVLLA